MRLDEITQNIVPLIKIDEELQDEICVQLYNLARYFINTHILYYYDKRDFIQELVWKAYNRLDKFDDSKGATFLTFTIYCWTNDFKLKLRALKKDKVDFTLNDMLINTDGENTEYLDMYIDNTISSLELLIENEKNNVMLNKVKHCPLVYELYLNGKTQMEIAKEYDVCQSNISRLFNKELKKLKKELENYA